MEAAIEVLNQIFFKFSPGIFVEFVRGYSETMWLMLLGFILHFMPKSTEQWALNRVTEMPLIAKATVLVLVIFLVIQIKSSDIQPFIYFQF